MEWWQPVSMVGTVVLIMMAIATFGWRVLDRMRTENRVAHDRIGESIARLRSDMDGHVAALRGEISDLRADTDANFAAFKDDLGGETAKVRDDLGGDIAKIREDLGSGIAKIREDLGGEIAKVREDLGGEIAKVREDLGGDIANVREGLAELRGELKGVNRSLRDLRQDFRVHVYGGTASA